MTMADLAPITVPPGQKVLVKVTINRGGASGPATIQLGGAPRGIVALPLEIPADKSEGQLSIAADETLGDQELKAPIKVVTKVGVAVAEKNLDVTVPKLSLPAFQSAKPVLLQPGGNEVVEITVNRNGFPGALDLRVENLPAKVTATIGKLEPDQSTVKLQIAAAADAPDVAQPLRVAATVCARPISVEVPVQIDRAPFRVQSLMVVNLKPGEKKRVEVPIERRSYNGALTVAPTVLPEGVSIQKVEILPDQKTAALEIVAGENARERVGTARLTGQGGQMSHSEAMVIRVRRDDAEGFVPRQLLNDPNMPLLRRGSFGGRLTAKSKRALLDAFGGTPESEAAVIADWVGWPPISRRTASGFWPPTTRTSTAATAATRTWRRTWWWRTPPERPSACYPSCAGVGIDRSPEEPEELVAYQKVVRRGIAFLINSQTRSKERAENGKLGGSMYAHAVATIALCEAYGLSTERHKDQLKLPAQRAIKFIAQAQHKAGGSRYGPGQEGDMSAVAWQFLAIRSGQLAGLMIGSDPLIRAERFVDSCRRTPRLREVPILLPAGRRREERSPLAHRRRTSHPPVPGQMEEREPGFGGGLPLPDAEPAPGLRRQRGRHLLLLLRDPGVAPHGRRGLRPLELPHARAPHPHTGEIGPPHGKLEPNRERLGLRRRSPLHHGPGPHDARSLLPPPSHAGPRRPRPRAIRPPVRTSFEDPRGIRAKNRLSGRDSKRAFPAACGIIRRKGARWMDGCEGNGGG